jgi:hypothetical protein
MPSLVIEPSSSTDVVYPSAAKFVVTMAIGLLMVSVAFVVLLTIILLATQADEAFQMLPQ